MQAPRGMGADMSMGKQVLEALLPQRGVAWYAYYRFDALGCSHTAVVG